MRKSVAIGLSGVLIASLAACSSGGPNDEDYPSEQITIYSPFDPGGGIDLAINTAMSVMNDTGVSDADMRLDNIPGGSGLVATSELAADHDGDESTLLLTSVSTLSASIQSPDEIGIGDMTPIAGLFAEYTYIYVPNDSPYESLDDIATDLEADAGSVTISGASLGSADNIVIADFAESIGVSFSDLSYLPLTGDENAAALLGGQTDVTAGGPDLLDLVDSGEVRVLAVSAPEALTSERVADVPTMSSLGYDVTQSNWRGLFGPPNMPDYAVEYWEDAVLEMQETDEWMSASDEYIWDPTPLGTDEFEVFLDDQTASLTSTLTDLGLVD